VDRGNTTQAIFSDINLAGVD